MHPSIKFLVILSTFFLIIAGCDKFKGDQGPAGPSLTGDLIGYAYLYDVNGTRTTDNSGITITAEGTTITATSASDGRWVLSGLTTGTYTFTFSKTGYGIRKIVGTQFVGGGQVYYGSTSLYQIPAFTITNLSASSLSGYVSVNGNLSGSLPTSYRYPRLFISTAPTVCCEPSKYSFTYSTSVSSSSTTLSISISTQTFNQYGIYSGQTVYIVAHAESYSAGSYIDLATGKSYFPCLNPTPSNIVNVVVP